MVTERKRSTNSNKLCCVLLLILGSVASYDFFCFRFVKEYFNEPRRGYGQQVVDIFHKLRAQKFVDPFGPAKEQFDGSGSYGNGGAMRVAPLALFCYSNYEELVTLVRRSAELTHTHKHGYDGTILQVNHRPHVFHLFS
jgi:poly(ADP-ribose) glycohydrolase ARH3